MDAENSFSVPSVENYKKIMLFHSGKNLNIDMKNVGWNYKFLLKPQDLLRFQAVVPNISPAFTTLEGDQEEGTQLFDFILNYYDNSVWLWCGFSGARCLRR